MINYPRPAHSLALSLRYAAVGFGRMPAIIRYIYSKCMAYDEVDEVRNGRYKLKEELP